MGFLMLKDHKSAIHLEGVTLTKLFVIQTGQSNSWIFYYEGQSEITEPYLIIFKSSKIDSFLDDISFKLYVIYSIT